MDKYICSNNTVNIKTYLLRFMNVLFLVSCFNNVIIDNHHYYIDVLIYIYIRLNYQSSGINVISTSQ